MNTRTKMLFFLCEGLLFWVLFALWFFLPSTWTQLLFVINAGVQIPLVFWVSEKFRNVVLRNIEIKKDLREESGINKKYPVIKYLRVKFQFFFKNVTAISIAAARLFFLVDQVQKDAKIQADHALEMNTALKEMSSVIEDISESTDKSKAQAEASYSSAETGVRQMNENVEVMGQLTESITLINQTMKELQHSTGQINQVMDVIQGISNQTNMLSLNAAIEAAKAGEYGKGFAVVAEEVRNLATRTDQSTEEISELIQSIENITNKVVKEVEVGTKLIGKGREVTLQSKDSFDQILENTNLTQNQAQEVAAAVEEQFRSIETVSKSMEDLSQSVQNIYTNIEESAKTARTLSTEGESFMAFLLEYKMGNRASELVIKLKVLKKQMEEQLGLAEKQGTQIWDREYLEVPKNSISAIPIVKWSGQ